MFYNKEISILSDTGYLDDNGLWVDGEDIVVKTIDVDLQPITMEIAYRDYGYTENVSYRVFADIDPLLKNGTTIQYMDYKLTIVKVVVWDDYCILLLSGVE